MRESIRGYADAVIEDARNDADGLATLAGDMAAVASVVAGSEDLQLVLTDPGVVAHARRGVVDDLFGSRVGRAAQLLLAFTVASGRVPELVEDLAALVERTAAARDGLHPVGPAVLSHHAALERLDGYASDVLGALDADGELGEIEDELFRFERIVSGSPELRDALTGRDLPADARAGLVRDLLGTKASAPTVRLASYATTIGRPREYLDLLAALVARVASESDRRLAEVRAVVALDDDQQARLADALSRIVGQRVDVRVVLDPSVLGGFVATIGDTVIDGSVRHRLDLLKERFGVTEASTTNQGVQS